MATAAGAGVPTIPTTRPPNWKTLAPPPPGGTTTFAHQSRLPRLPLPQLSDTLRKLKETLRPIAYSPAEFAQVSAQIDEFGKPGGVGETLHRFLEQRREEKGREHWLEEWWDDVAYLKYMDPIVINVSYYYGFDLPTTTNQAKRAAELAYQILHFRKQLREGSLAPESTKAGPMCMDTYRWLFDCCRIPGGEGGDWSISHADQPDSDATVVVFRNNRAWTIDVHPQALGRLLTPSELEAQIQKIISHPLSAQSHPEFGILPYWDRQSWYKTHNVLQQSLKNRASLHAIHKAAFLLDLSDQSPSPDNVIEFSHALWHGVPGEKGDMGTRFPDKPLNMVVYANGLCGVMGEHSVMDGTPVARMCDDIVKIIHAFPAQTESQAAQLAPPCALEFEFTDEVLKYISKAKSDTVELIRNHKMGYLLTHGHGNAVAKNAGFSPDSWAQMIVQLAYGRLLSSSAIKGTPLDTGDKSNWKQIRAGGTYEAASTRAFYKGRTECIRVVSEESDAWVDAMMDSTSTDSARRELMRKAAAVHINRAREGGKAMGVDRHVLGMKLAHATLGKNAPPRPALFDSPLLARSSTWVLSTSAIWSAHFPSYGWGEVVPNGFGVAYMTGFKDKFQFTITSRTGMPTEAFVQEIEKAARDVKALFEDVETSSEGGRSKL